MRSKISHKKYLKSDTDNVNGNEFKLNVVMIFELFPVLDESLHDVNVLFLPDFVEGLVNHQQIKLLEFELVEEILGRNDDGDSLFLFGEMKLEIIVLTSVFKVFVDFDGFLLDNRSLGTVLRVT